MLSHDSLGNIYRTNFLLMHQYQYSLTELEDMIPWERQVYLALLTKHIQEENERLKQQRTG
jgi:hypothetical protein